MTYFDSPQRHDPFDLDRLELWANALLSGAYIQGRHDMMAPLAEPDEDGEIQYAYCCLGVACVLANEADPKIRLPWIADEIVDRRNSYPTEPVNRFFGGSLRHLPLNVPNNDGLTCTPARANDTLKLSFEQIGNAILQYVAEHRATQPEPQWVA